MIWNYDHGACDRVIVLIPEEVIVTVASLSILCLKKLLAHQKGSLGPVGAFTRRTMVALMHLVVVFQALEALNLLLEDSVGVALTLRRVDNDGTCICRHAREAQRSRSLGHLR